MSIFTDDGGTPDAVSAVRCTDGHGLSPIINVLGTLCLYLQMTAARLLRSIGAVRRTDSLVLCVYIFTDDGDAPVAVGAVRHTDGLVLCVYIFTDDGGAPVAVGAVRCTGGLVLCVYIFTDDGGTPVAVGAVRCTDGLVLCVYIFTDDGSAPVAVGAVRCTGDLVLCVYIFTDDSGAPDAVGAVRRTDGCGASPIINVLGTLCLYLQMTVARLMRSVQYAVLTVVGRVLCPVIRWIFSLIYSPSSKVVDPVQNPLCLMSAVDLAQKIRSREVRVK
jgi:hypothetical protein